MNNVKPFTWTEANPAMVRAVTVAVAFLASLGIGWAANVDGDTIATWAIVAGVVLPILQGLWTRYVVTPNVKVLARVTTDGRVVAGDAAVEPTGTEVDRVANRLQGSSDNPIQYDGPAPTRAVVSVKPELLQSPAA